MSYFFSALIGYLLGAISPSYILSRFKRVDIRADGTKNLGASNTFMHFGRFWGAFVMLFDIFKAFTAVKLCGFIFDDLAFSGLIAGVAAVIGHNYPFYLKFKGGKGLASFGGLVLGISPLMFLFMLVSCIIITFIANYGFVLALSAAVMLPILVYFHYKSWIAVLIALVCCVNMFYKHTENFRRASRKEETKFREFIAKYILKLKSKKKH